MAIERYEIQRCEMPLEDPNWRFALGATSAARGWIVKLTSETGIAGYGYAPAIPHMGSTLESLPTILQRFEPLLIGVEVFAVEHVLAALDASLAGSLQAKAAIDCAMHDLIARTLGVPLYHLLGGKLRDSVPVLRILAIKSPAEMAEQAGRLFDQGYRYFKIKIHGDIDEDVERVRAIRQRVGSAAHLTVDANQSYSAKDAVYALNRMAEHRIELVEQPVPAGDLKGLKLVTDSVPVTIEADEGAGSIDEIMQLVGERIVDAVSLKIPKLGGIRNTIAAARLCEAGRIKYRLGAHVGTRLLNAHAVQLAVSLPGVDYACELGEFTRMFDDPFTGLEVENGWITVPDAIGCGVQPIVAPVSAAVAL